MSPTALQRRMMHGNVYPDPRKAELALRRFFTTENLNALRELALMRVANQVDEDLLARWRKDRSPETRERIVVAVSGRASSAELIRRAGRIAQRVQGDLLVVHIRTGSADEARRLDEVRALASELGGEVHEIAAEDPVEALLSFAYQQHVTQVVVGEQAEGSWIRRIWRGSFVDRLIRRAANIDIHVIARTEHR
jgi:two-component system sensor histidine kinase KdpD